MRILSLAAATAVALSLSACYGGTNAAAGGGSPASLAGAPAISYDLKRTDGKRDGLDRYRGEVVVLNLWATWCAPCREEIPDLERLYREYRARGVVVLGVNEGESARVAQAFARGRGVTFPILLDEGQQYGRSYTAQGLPTTIVVDRHGRIVRGVDGALTLAEMRDAVAPALQAR